MTRVAPQMGPAVPIDVFIVADNRLVREALSKYLQKQSGIRVIAQSAFGSETLSQIVGSKPYVLILDSATLISSCTQVVQEAIRTVPRLRVLLIGMESDPVMFLRLVRAGIAGYVLKSASANEVVEAVLSVATGKGVCPPELCMALFDWVARQEVPISNLNGRLQLRLTGREVQILQIIRYGCTNKEVALQLNLSEQTVKNHVHRILHKLGTSDRVAALEFLHVQGLGAESTNCSA
jgi:DNA-binding NarL/FixJ family response regulator